MYLKIKDFSFDSFFLGLCVCVCVCVCVFFFFFPQFFLKNSQKVKNITVYSKS